MPHAMMCERCGSRVSDREIVDGECRSCRDRDDDVDPRRAMLEHHDERDQLVTDGGVVEEGAETLAVPTGDDRVLYEEGCPECDQPPADDVETLSTLFDLYSAAEDEGNARCRACQTVFDVATGEVVSSA